MRRSLIFCTVAGFVAAASFAASPAPDIVIQRHSPIGS